MVVHIHANEQRREIDECESRVRHAADRAAGRGGPARTAHDRRPRHPRVRRASSICWPRPARCVCACPTTEANLGDGFLPAAELLERGVPVCIGTRLEHDHRSACGAARDRGTAPAGLPNGATCWCRRAMTARPPTCSRSAADNGARCARSGRAARVSWRSISRHAALAGVAAADLPAALIFGGASAAVHPA